MSNLFAEWFKDSTGKEEFEHLKEEELAEHLETFYVEVRDREGQLYNSNSLKAIRYSINRHLQNPPHSRKIDIMKGKAFEGANKAFEGVVKKIMMQNVHENSDSDYCGEQNDDVALQRLEMVSFPSFAQEDDIEKEKGTLRGGRIRNRGTSNPSRFQKTSKSEIARIKDLNTDQAAFSVAESGTESTEAGSAELEMTTTTEQQTKETTMSRRTKDTTGWTIRIVKGTKLRHILYHILSTSKSYTYN